MAYDSGKSSTDTGPNKSGVPFLARPRLTVLGTGYLGITRAAAMASLGFEVLGIDTDSAKVASLAAGQIPIFEPDLPEFVTEGLNSGQLRFSTSYADAAALGDVYFICAGTPQLHGGIALDAAQILHGLGAHVTVYDPVSTANAAAQACPELSYADSIRAAAQDARLVMLLAAWQEFAELVPADLDGIVASKNIIDARNALDLRRWHAAGWRVSALGVGSEPNWPGSGSSVQVTESAAWRSQKEDSATLLDTLSSPVDLTDRRLT